MRIKEIFLYTTTFLWGVLTGGIVFSHLVYFPSFVRDLPTTAAIVHEPFNMIDDTFWMTIHPLAMLTTIICLVMYWKAPEGKFIRITAIIYFLMFITSMTYFVPELEAYAASPTSGISAAEWKSRTDLWLILSWIRGVFMFTGFVMMLRAMRVPRQI